MGVQIAGRSCGSNRGIGDKKLAKARASTVEMGFRVADGPIEHGGDFRMFVTLNIVQDNNEFL